MEHSIILKLRNFQQKDKFSSKEWQLRGLGSSTPDICQKVNGLLSQCCDDLIGLIENEETRDKQLRKVLKKGLKRFWKLEYDTEEKEFICEYFDELSKIVDVKFANDLNRWLYGFVLNSFIKIVKTFNSSEESV